MIESNNEFTKLENGAKKIAIVFMISIFGLSSISMFNAVFHYIGLGRFQTVLSTALFLTLDIISILYILKSLHKNINKKIYLFIFAINILNILPIAINGDVKGIIQYIIFTVPYTFFAAGLIFSKDIRDYFFEFADKLRIPVLALSLGYIGLLWGYSLLNDADDILNIEVIHYGNIAWFFIIFYFIGIINTANNKYKGKFFVPMIYSFVLVYTICCTGLRTAVISMMFTLVLAVMYVAFNKEIDRKSKIALALQFVLILAFTLCIVKFEDFVIPDSSRVVAVKDDFTYDLKKDTSNAPKIEVDEDVELTKEEMLKLLPKEEIRADSLPVGNMTTNNLSTLEDTFRYYIFSSDETEAATVEKLHKDIKNSEYKYILVNKENIKFASEFTVPRGRNYLWLGAINEFNKNKLFGNGIMHYQNKYIGTFPHNVVLEALSDIGIVGTGIIGISGFLLFVLFIVRAYKRNEYEILRILFLTSCYLPSFFIYTSLYKNEMLTFFFSVLIFYFLKTRGNKEV